MKARTVFKAIFYGLAYFVISGVIPQITKFVTQLFGVILDFEPRTVTWLLIIGIIIGVLVTIEKLLEEKHPSGAGVFGILRYVVGLIDVTLYYNLLLHVGIIYPMFYTNLWGFTVPLSDPISMFLATYFGGSIYLANNFIFFALYLITLGMLIYGGYVLNFFRYIYQIGMGYRLTEE